MSEGPTVVNQVNGKLLFSVLTFDKPSKLMHMETCAENTKEDDVTVDGSVSNVEISDSGFQRLVSSDVLCHVWYVRNVPVRAAGVMHRPCQKSGVFL